MLIDLQLHSTYSDGYLTPTQLAEFAARRGIQVAALTDHNTVSGLHEFVKACHRYKIKPIKGMELYCKLNSRRFNILWYNFDETDSALHDTLRLSQVRRRRYMRTILLKLTKHGFRLNVNGILDKYNHYVPVNHIIDEISACPENLAKIKRELKTDSPSEGQVIMEYFRDKRIGALKNSLIDFGRVVKLRKRIGGQLILCHPAKSNRVDRDFWKKLKDLGLDGVEVLSPHHPFDALVHVQRLAREFNFITTGGSDFHRLEGNNYRVQKSWDYFRIDTKYLRKVSRIIA